jgi:hypothetical protein
MRTGSLLTATIATLAGMLILTGARRSALGARWDSGKAASRLASVLPSAEHRAPSAAVILLQHAIQSRLDRMDRELSRGAEELSRTGLSGNQTRVVLARLCHRHPDLVDACTVDMKGRMIAVEPRTHRDFEGSDISQQEQVIRLHRTKRPVLSRAFHAVEGFDAVDLEWPVFSPRSELIGSVSILMRPEELVAGIIRSKTRGSPVHVWVIQRDGRILYAEDAAEIGRNLLRGPLHGQGTRLRSMARQIVTARSGSSGFPAPEQARERSVEDQGSWGTVGLHGTEWRVIAVEGTRHH